METRILKSIGLFILLFIPFLSPSIETIYISIGCVTLSAFLLVMTGNPGFKIIHRHLKYPRTFALGLWQMAVLILVSNPYLFAIGLVLISLIMSWSLKTERLAYEKILGLRFNLYDNWVSDFLPGAIPVAKLPSSTKSSLLLRVKELEWHFFVMLIAVILGSVWSVLRPFNAYSLNGILFHLCLLLFFIRFFRGFSLHFKR
jgi:hypothetical protein